MRLIISMFMLLSFVACTKKRDEKFVQGQGKDLLEISQFDGAEFDAETLEKISDYKENPSLSKGTVVAADKDNSSDTELSAVKVNTKADLLGDAPFIARAHQKTGYKVKYIVNKDFLVVMKVADKKLIHPQEAVGAMKLADGRLAVAVVGYPIKGFFNSENVEENGAKTNKITEVTENGKEGSRYFKIDKNARTLYKLQEKLDLFTKEYFLGEDGKSEWYYSQTIIGAADSSYTGYQLLQQDNELNGLSKVRFTYNSAELVAINVNLDSRIDNNDEVNQLPLVVLPVEWKEYRAKQAAGKNNIAMEEEENNSVPWHKRSHVKVNFAGARTNTTFSLGQSFVDLEIDTNYMSFTVYDSKQNMRFKQSFMRDLGNRKYQAKRLLKEDFEKFGFFNTQKHEINNYEKYKQEDYGKNEFINRYNVANGEVVFYFTEGSDERLIPYAAKAADEWSEAFRKAGVPLKITANTTERKRLGDIRYNQINLIRTADGSNLFGYGPSITDPRTGEIISATTNMHITSIVSSLTSHIRNYLLFKAGKTSSMSVYSQPTQLPDTMILKGDSVVFKDNKDASAFLFKKIPMLSANNRLEMKTVEHAPQDKKSKINNNKNYGREFDIGITGKNLNHDIDKLCPELKSVAEMISHDIKNEKENELVIACAEKLVPGKMMGTLLHEMGHNFGLRHNFYGSVDAMNFLTKEETGTDEQVRSSSVMEYSSFGEDRLTKVGRYDIAAIRYGYGDAVETQNGEIVKLKTDQTIDENLKAQSKSAKRFLFCTDEDVEVGTDPMCARHDAGTTPEEIVNHIIAEYNESIADLNYRLGRGREWIEPARVTNYRIRRFWVPLKKIYDEWRFKLNDQLGVGNEYLENFDAEKLKVAIEEKTKNCDMQKDSASAECRLAQYQKAAERIFQFTMQIATLPPKYCIGDRNGKIASVEFADVRRIVMAINKFVPASCLDQTVKAYIQEKYSFVPTSESGYELEDVRLDMKVKMSKTRTDWYGNALPEPPDVIGLMPEKAIAVEILAVRTPLSMSSADKSFWPNLLDEPKFREEALSYVADRLSKGISAPKVTAMNKNIKIDQNYFFEKFKYEKRFIDNMVSSIFWGLDVPDKGMATKQRKKKFLVKYTDKKDILDKAKYKVAGLDGTTFYAIMSEEGSEAKKLMQMLETLPKRMEAASPLNTNTFDGLQELSKSLLDADEKKIDARKLMEFSYMLIEDEVPMSMATARSQDQKNVDKYRFHWKKVFAKEVAAARDAFASFKDASSRDGADPIAALNSYVSDLSRLDPAGKTPGKKGEVQGGVLDKTAELVFDPTYILNQKTVSERIEAYKKEAALKPKLEMTEDFFNYEELSTQVDMIISVLRTMTEY